MVFASRSSEKNRKYSPTGEPEKNKYIVKLDEHGHKIVEQNGKTNVYLKIQEELEDTKIENIIARFTAGDPEALTVRDIAYTDITGLPKDLAEAQNAICQIKNQFEELPTEIKKLYGYSSEQYVADYGSKNWKDNMGITEYEETLKRQAKAIKEEQKEQKTEGEVKDE